MRILNATILAALATTLATAPAHAAPHQLKFVSGSGVNGWNTQVGTYKGQLDGQGGASSLANTRWGFYTDAMTRYRQAAWLAWQFYNPAYRNDWKYIHAAIWHLMTPTQPGVTRPADIALVNGWLNSAATNYARYDFSHVFVLTDVAVARCHASNPSIAGPWNGCGHQEQITFTAPLTVTTPEPASMVLLATGLIALTVTSRRRRRR